MSSKFEDRFTRIVPRELAEFAIDCTYTNAAGASKSVKIVLIPNTLITSFTSNSKNYEVQQVEISCRNDIEGVVDPKIYGKDAIISVSNGDRLNISGNDVWYVRDILNKNDCGFCRLLVSTTRGPIQEIN